MTTLDALYRRAAASLRQGAVATPELDARWLVAEAAGAPAQDVTLRGAAAVDDAVATRAMALVARRLAGEPVDRILGTREFWGLGFRLGPATLSPRPDTETVVEAALATLPDRAAAWRILDLGTGSGAILTALLHERPAATGIGVDRSLEAARIARDNALANGVGARAAFLVADWAAALGGPFDLIVSNPPYIPAGAIEGLAVEVRAHDPRLALDGGADGLDAYRAIAAQAEPRLAPGGALVLELGAGQEEAVAAVLAEAGLEAERPARRDLGGVPRALTARAHKKGPGEPGPR
ncbi:peptide chain release factor N(5)-glutamine methyltransferase [Labrys wisconsinensis]|uniref:Release factor glutamine methyltransferase n=1 Tax=Labrys wisconsinensis TaxID=425677 RepID=A0ABU0JK67_9HYPH|nr:peptide chain release factor N(5)-glutamine methyltransferase [Labrys wisconsinensis]MDQ0474682.1 release factor glutamine methyltransferase [Labrys wisconsinensis]